MPSAYDLCRTGAMTKAVRKRARLIITVFGGDCAMPIAVRNSESTTTMRVKEVTIIRIEGAMLRMVISAMSCSARSVTPVPSPSPMLISCAMAGERLNNKMPAATISAVRIVHIDKRFNLTVFG